MKHLSSLLPLALLVATSALVACGSSTMGVPCTTSATCGVGSCLKGVCSGYACEEDADCVDDHVCGEVYGTRACVMPCDDDGDCKGDQTCALVPASTEDGADTAQYCM